MTEIAEVAQAWRRRRSWGRWRTLPTGAADGAVQVAQHGAGGAGGAQVV